MRLFQKSIALLLSVLMLLSLAACDTQQEKESQYQVDPQALEAYQTAMALYENADSYEITFHVKTNKQVGTDTFTDIHSGTSKYLGLTTKEPKALVETRHTLNDQVFDSVEASRNDTTTYSFLDEQYVYRGTELYKNFSKRQIPAKLLDPEKYGNIIFSPDDPELILFSASVSAEDWIPDLPEEYALLKFEADGWARIKDGSITELQYNVTYTKGAAVYSSQYKTSLRTPEILDEELNRTFNYKTVKHVSDMTLPYAIRYATGILFRYQQGTVRIYDELYRVQTGKTYVEELTIFSCTDEHDLPAMLATESKLLANAGIFETVRRKQTRGMCYIDRDGEGFSETESDGYFTDLEEQKELQNVPLPHYAQLNNLTINEISNFIILEGELTYSSMKTCLTRAGELEGNNPQLHANATPNTATCRMAIDKDTGFVTAARIILVANRSKNSSDLIAFARDLYIEPGSYGSYEAIFEIPYPDTEPPQEEKATPLFYEITDREGNTAYLLGTIHTGDNRTAYLPQSIYDAFGSADALAVETDLTDFEERLEKDEALAQAYAASLYFTDGTTLQSYLQHDDLYTRAERLLFAMGYGFYSDVMKPAAAASAIDNWYAGLFGNLTSDKGMDMRLLKLAEDKNKKVYEIEDFEEHYNTLTDYSKETQVMMLEEAVEMKKWESMYSSAYLYELWCEGNEKKLRKELTTVIPEGLSSKEQAYYEEYVQKMITERDRIMADGIKSYLKSGETVFVAVGLAHVIGEGGIIDILEAEGYTVTLVK